MKELQLIQVQEEHIKRLEQKLKEQKRKFIDKFVSTPGWAEFLLRHTKTYYRPKDPVTKLKSALHGGKFGIEFPNEYPVDGSSSNVVQIAIGYSNSGINFRTSSIPMHEIEEFIDEHSKEREEAESLSCNNRYNYWYTESYTVI